jgi:hypothetical protein
MAYESKRRFAFKRSERGHRARPLTISMYPEHLAILETRQSELNVNRSVLVGLLLEIDEQQGLLPRELVRRLRSTPWTTQKKQAA